MDPTQIPRRALLGGAAGAAAGLAIGATSSAGSSRDQLATRTAWSGPTRADWSALRRSLDGDLVRRADRDFDQVRRLFQPRFDGIRPLAVVEATSAEDVAEAVRSARRFDLRVRPKSGGHSYVGQSTVRDGLVVDVGRLARVRYDPDARVATVGAGAGLYSVHAALADHHRSIPTGTCPTVGAAGLTLGGGIGVDSRAYGLTCDVLRGVTIVTAAGRILRVDPTRHRDLFWASRGGAGGFGIATSFRYDTHRARPMGFFLLSFPWHRAPAVLRGWTARVRQMPRSSWANLRLEAGSDGSTRVRIVGTCRAGDQDAEATAMERAIGVDAASVSTFERSFMEGVRFLGGGSTSARQSFAAGSDVLAGMPRDLSRRLPRVIARRAAAGRSGVAILDPLTGAVQDVRPGASAFPWRRHLADVQWYVGLPARPTRSQVDSAYDWIGSAHRSIRAWSSGGYVNYLEPRRRVGSYFGDNLARLAGIVDRYDPGGMFRSPYTPR